MLAGRRDRERDTDSDYDTDYDCENDWGEYEDYQYQDRGAFDSVANAF